MTTAGEGGGGTGHSRVLLATTGAAGRGERAHRQRHRRTVRDAAKRVSRGATDAGGSRRGGGRSGASTDTARTQGGGVGGVRPGGCVGVCAGVLPFTARSGGGGKGGTSWELTCQLVECDVPLVAA